MSRFEHGVIGIETLVATLGWDHATLMVVSRMQWEMLPPETKTAIQHRVMVAADCTLWVQDYLVWAAWWEHDGRGGYRNTALMIRARGVAEVSEWSSCSGAD